MAQRIFASYIQSTKIPRVRPYFKNKKFYKPENFVYKARKHPELRVSGPEPDAPSGLGAAPALGTRRFPRIILAVGPPVETDPREMTTAFFITAFKVFFRRLVESQFFGSSIYSQVKFA